MYLNHILIVNFHTVYLFTFYFIFLFKLTWYKPINYDNYILKYTNKLINNY